jgi:hypothetical protein
LTISDSRFVPAPTLILIDWDDDFLGLSCDLLPSSSIGASLKGVERSNEEGGRWNVDLEPV